MASEDFFDPSVPIDQLDKELHISYGTKYSVLNLVDLAGSERLSESGMHAVEET